MKLNDTIELTVTKVEDTRFEVDHGGVIVGIARHDSKPLKIGDKVLIRHNGIQQSGSLRNPVRVYP
jgi:hypothetical protein